MISLRSLISLGLSLGALAFVVWMILIHPDHQSVYGPPLGSRANVAVAHTPSVAGRLSRS